MNYSSRSYAQSFCEVALKEKTDSGIEKCIQNLLALVRQNRDQRKLSEIILLSEKIIGQKTGNRNLLIETARAISKENEGIISSFIKKTDMVKRKISPEIIGGIKVTIDDELQLDESFSKKIKNILNI